LSLVVVCRPCGAVDAERSRSAPYQDRIDGCRYAALSVWRQRRGPWVSVTGRGGANRRLRIIVASMKLAAGQPRSLPTGASGHDAGLGRSGAGAGSGRSRSRASHDPLRVSGTAGAVTGRQSSRPPPLDTRLSRRVRQRELHRSRRDHLKGTHRGVPRHRSAVPRPPYQAPEL
jgi:hypothetical protein